MTDLREKDVLDLFLETQALLEGHFELSSGKHSNRYFQCALLLQYPDYAGRMAKALAWEFRGEKIDAVIGPALGGVTFAYEMARQLKCRGFFAERVEEKMQLRRGFEIQKGESVLLVEDVITTGGSILEVAELVQARGGEVAGLAAIVYRGAAAPDFPYPLKSLIQIKPELYEPAACPLCLRREPLTKPGSKKINS